jgi:hypothetical protein
LTFENVEVAVDPDGAPNSPPFTCRPTTSAFISTTGACARGVLMLVLPVPLTYGASL